ncbi:hypothetical protein EDB89DRAFT_1916399 [Lactarius sanguifluus]|nr:hypothetical protein EDB89DRAFT_1916399 [Lactarius sanguifluus]
MRLGQGSWVGRGWWGVGVVVLLRWCGTCGGTGSVGVGMESVGCRGGVVAVAWRVWRDGVVVVVVVEVATAHASGQLGEGVEMAAWWWWWCQGNGVRVRRVDIVRARSAGWWQLGTMPAVTR